MTNSFDNKKNADAAASHAKKTLDSIATDQKDRAAASAQAQLHAAERVMSFVKQCIAFNQSAIDAYHQSSQALFTGSQDLFRRAVRVQEAALSENIARVREVAASRTAKEHFELQANIAHHAASTAVAEYSRFAQASIDLTKQVWAPFQERNIAAAEFMHKVSAA